MGAEVLDIEDKERKPVRSVCRESDACLFVTAIADALERPCFQFLSFRKSTLRLPGVKAGLLELHPERRWLPRLEKAGLRAPEGVKKAIAQKTGS